MQNSSETTFRDRPLVMEESGSRKWIYAKQPKGKWYTRRTIFAWFCILFLIFAPIIKINGKPLMLFDIANRKFYIFSQLIWAQDAYLLALIMAITVVSIVLFTVIYGRLWCGWACPQTIFMEMVFRRIEYLFDGKHKKRNNKKAKTPAEILRRVLKLITFFLTSVLITHVFLNWFVGIDRLINIVTSPINENLMGFALMLAISTFYFFVYAYFREQICTMFCPYGRMQGVLLDSKSIAITYDYKRGEPRGVNGYGDCIDCKQCIAVCPTGIDIKNGSQLECINCTACIDECNSVMKKQGKPENLIRYDSYHGIETGKKQIFNTRTISYSIVLLILFVILGFALGNRTIIDSTLLRVPGTMFQQINDSTISNIYNFKVINKTQDDKELELKLITPNKGEVSFANKDALLKRDSKLESIVIIKLNRNQLSGKNTDIKIGIYSNNILLESYDTNFLGPK